MTATSATRLERPRLTALVAASVLAAGCGRIGFQPASDRDASTDGAGLDSLPMTVVATFSDNLVADTSLLAVAGSETDNYGASTQAATEASSWIMLLRFEVSSIPTNATVISALLRMTTDPGISSESTGTVSAYPMAEAWVEGTQIGAAGAASYLERSPGVAWMTAGAQPPSRGVVAVGALFPVNVATSYTTQLTASLIEGWVRDPASNFGIQLVNDGADRAQWATREASIPAVRPSLTVEYVP